MKISIKYYGKYLLELRGCVKMDHNNLIHEFRQKSTNEYLHIIERFCERNGLSGNDGLYGQLQYVKALIRDGTIKHHPGLGRDLFEISYTIWALERKRYSHIIDGVARNFMKGGGYGDTSAYLSSGEGNYFKNFLLQAQIGLRLVESGLDVTCGEDQNGDPDYFIEDTSLEVKAPASRLALFQALIKGVQQIEDKGLPGIIIVSLDHMVARGMIPDTFLPLPEEIVSIILSSLPTNDDSNTIGVIAEWGSWDGEEAFTVIQPLMNSVKGKIEDEKLKVHKIWSALSSESVDHNGIIVRDPLDPFPYGINYKGITKPEAFFLSTWPNV